MGSNLEAPELTWRPALDGMRGLAMLAVFLTHSRWSETFQGGFLGVHVFFVLSGFLITSILLQEWRAAGGISLRSFYLKRFWRLFPAAAFFFAGIFLMALLFEGEAFVMGLDPAAAAEGIARSLAGIVNWNFAEHGDKFATAGWENVGWGMGHVWSLSIEQQFYLAWPVLLILALRFGRGHRDLLMLTAVLCCVAATTPVWIGEATDERLYFGTDFEATPLLVGCLGAILFVSGAVTAKTARSTLFRLASAASVVVLFGSLFVGDRDSGFTYAGGIQLVALAALVLVFTCAFDEGIVARWLGQAPLVYLGKRSYAMYLWTAPILIWTSPLPLLVHLIGGFCLALALSEISWRLLEAPATRRRRRLASSEESHEAIPAAEKQDGLPEMRLAS